LTSSAGEVEHDVVAGVGGVRTATDRGTAEEAEAEDLDVTDSEASAVGVRGPSRFISRTGRRVLTPRERKRRVGAFSFLKQAPREASRSEK
jgi:hypothetical protein